jgi:thioesterase domain-containing protein/acyl carrier protein
MIALGGELVDGDVVRLTADLFKPRHIATGFGTTETGVVSLHVLDSDDDPPDPVPVGYAVPDVELHILDSRGTPLPVGEAGEVAVASPFLFAGYWGHPELSDRVLTADPAGRSGWRMYRTGDLGRLDDAGTLTILGRLDTKVKVRGRFVVLGDVEADLHRMDGVTDAVVLSAEREGRTELIAVVAPEAGATLDPKALRARLLMDREPFRVPTEWQIVDELPRLPNGKLDRRALLDRDHDSRSPTTTWTLDTDDVEGGVVRELRDLWTRLLTVPDIGLDDDFTSLGGDSLLAAQMLVMAEQRLGVTVPMSELLHARTINHLAAVIRRLGVEPSNTRTTVVCVQRGNEAARPRLWFVPDLPGSAYRVRHLAAALDPEQPVWSFESPFLRGEPNPYTVLDTFVARLLGDVRRAQPRGPYALAGYSFGGICAYEMARQLRRDGEQVGFLGVIDVGPGYRGPNWTEDHSPPWPYFGVPQPPPEGASPADAARHYREMVRHNPLGAARHLTLRTGLARRIDRRRFAADLRRTGRVRPEWRLWYAWEEHWRLAVKAWDRSRPYDGEVDLFWADQTGATDATMGWGDLVSDLNIHRFPGFHDDLLETEGAPALADVLDAVIRDRLAGFG